MSSRFDISTLLLYSMMILCIGIYTPQSIAQTDSTQTDSTSAKKDEKEEKKDLSTLKKILSFKNFFHHDDSTRLARRYIRWHQKLMREKKNYLYQVNYDELNITLGQFKRQNEFPLAYEVLGWYPFWEEDLYKTLNYSLLTTVAYFSYEVDPRTGKATTTHNWETTPVIDTLLKKDKRVLLTVTNFGNSNNKKLLKNNKATATLVSEIVRLLNMRGAHGVCIDFEGVMKSQKNDYSRFITLLYQELKKENKNYLIYLTVPAVDWEKSIDYDALLPLVDVFTIMGYDYYGKTSKVAGPVAPLESGKIWDPFNLTTSVDYYLANKIPPSKLILALPFYGHIWNTKGGGRGSRSTKFVEARTYDYIQANLGGSLKRYDSVSHSAYYSYVILDSTRRDKAQYRQCWFDDEVTFGTKLNLIKQKKLNGLGIWALGYAKGFPGLWSAIETNFCNPTEKTCPTDTTIDPPSTDITHSGTSGTGGNNSQTGSADAQSINGKDANDGTPAKTFWDKLTDINAFFGALKNYQTLLLLALAFVVIFGGAGFFISMFDYKTRSYIFNSRAYTIYYAGLILLLALVPLHRKGLIDNVGSALIGGFVIGAVAIYFIVTMVRKVKSDLP